MSCGYGAAVVHGALALLAGVVSVEAQQVIIGSGQTLTPTDLAAGVFEGQAFVLGPGTTFVVQSGGELRPGANPDLLGAAVSVEGGGVLRGGTHFVNVSIVLGDGSQVLGWGTTLGDGVTLSCEGASTDPYWGASGDAVVNMYAGYLDVFDGLAHDAVFNLYDGSGFTEARNIGNSVVNQCGGDGGYLARFEAGTRYRVSGGDRIDPLRLMPSSTATFYVREAAINGVPLDLTTGVPTIITQRFGTFTGTFVQNGTTFEADLSENELTATSFTGEIFSADATIEVVRPLGGDFNLDGAANGDDVMGFLFVQSKGVDCTDRNVDGNIDAFDTATLLNEF
ncbi:MAG: hypothetical protein AAGI30_06655 [Planctomycetota bacterium]